MITTLLLLLAAPVQADPPSRSLSSQHATSWSGTWTKGNAKVVFSQSGGSLEVSMSLDGEVLQQGKVEGGGGTRQAGMDGCGADMTLSGDTLKVSLDGPECPVELEGSYSQGSTRQLTHCGGSERSQFRCEITPKGSAKPKLLEVCAGHELIYRFGYPGKVELTLKGGVAKERPLASGMEYNFMFTNEGYGYNVYLVESSRTQDNGAGVLVSKDGKEVAHLSCLEGWTSTR